MGVANVLEMYSLPSESDPGMYGLKADYRAMYSWYLHRKKGNVFEKAYICDRYTTVFDGKFRFLL